VAAEQLKTRLPLRGTPPDSSPISVTRIISRIMTRPWIHPIHWIQLPSLSESAAILRPILSFCHLASLAGERDGDILPYRSLLRSSRASISIRQISSSALARGLRILRAGGARRSSSGRGERAPSSAMFVVKRRGSNARVGSHDDDRPGRRRRSLSPPPSSPPPYWQRRRHHHLFCDSLTHRLIGIRPDLSGARTRHCG